MTKKLMIIALLCTLCAPSFGQFRLIDFGIKGGINVDRFEIFKDGSKPSDIWNKGSVGYHLGLVSRINLLSVHIQPELNYNWHRMNIELEGNTGSAKVTAHTFEVPVLAGIKLLFIRLQAGPVFNLMNNTKVKGGNTSIDTVDITKPSVSFAAGLGIDLFKLTFDIRYNGQFKRANQTIMTSGESAGTFHYKTNFNNWSFSLGYMF